MAELVPKSTPSMLSCSFKSQNVLSPTAPGISLKRSEDISVKTPSWSLDFTSSDMAERRSDTSMNDILTQKKHGANIRQKLRPARDTPAYENKKGRAYALPWFICFPSSLKPARHLILRRRRLLLRRSLGGHGLFRRSRLLFLRLGRSLRQDRKSTRLNSSHGSPSHT